MPDKDFVFVEQPEASDPGIYMHYLISPGAQRATSVKNMVDKILNQLGRGDKIKSIRIIGHGFPGVMSIGTPNFFLTAPDNPNIKGKYLSAFNQDEWSADLQRLKGKFTQDSAVHLRGCNVGADKEGSKFVFMLRNFLDVGEVTAPSGVVAAWGAVGKLQSSKRGDASAPKPIYSVFNKKSWKK